MSNNFPVATVACAGRGPNITHARLTRYPRVLTVEYGEFGQDGFIAYEYENLPFVAYPELYAVHDGVRWNLEEVYQMFDLADDESVLTQ